MIEAFKKAGIIQEVICPYCGEKSSFVSGKEIYPHRKDLFHKKFYECFPCNAYVGCHEGTTNPLGRLANPELRAAKMRAHAAFDPLWKNGEKKRGSAYAWLAEKLGVVSSACHIGMFDVDTCDKVVEVCTRE